MADITDPSGGLDHPSPGDDLTGNGVDSRGTKRPRTSMAGDDDDDDDEKGGRERRKIEIKFIQDKSRRHITFSKRKAGIMKKVCAACPNQTYQTDFPFRPTNSPCSPERKSFSSSSQKLVWSTLSPRPSSNLLSPRPKARTSSRYVSCLSLFSLTTPADK